MADKKKRGMTDQTVIAALNKKFDKGIAELKILKQGVITGKLTSRDHILKVCQFLKGKLNFKYPFSITAVEYPDNYELVYHIASYENNNMIELHLPIPKDDPKVMSVVRIWKGANGHEREAYDMMGIIFETHPDLRRILLPEDADFFPLRKDFPLGGNKER